MKKFILLLSLGLIVSALGEGCGGKESNEHRLSVEQLAELIDFHAWKVPIPESLQPVKKARLVVVRHDGTVVPKFESGDLSSAPCAPCAFILLGFRVEGGVFKGHFHIRDSKGAGMGWPLNFKDEFADSKNLGWAITGTTVWNGNRAQLASAYKPGEKQDSILAIELVK